MDVALVACIGAGLTLWSSGIDDDIPDGTYARGVAVVRGLAQHGDREKVDQLVSQLVGEIWLEWRNSRRSRTVLIEHLLQLPAIVDAHRPDPSVVTGAIAEAGKIRRGGGSVDLVAHRLASDIILGARTAGDIAERQLDETLCFFLLSRLLSSLLARNDALLALRPAFDATFGRAREAAAPAKSDTVRASGNMTPPISPEPQLGAVGSETPQRASHAIAADIQRIADEFFIPVLALDAAASRLATQSSEPASLTEIEQTASCCAEIFARISAAPPQALLAVVAEALERGELAAAEDLLADGEAVSKALGSLSADETARAEPTFDAVQQNFEHSLAWRILRGQLAELASDQRNAARHYAYARTMVPPGARQLCGPLLQRKAGALVAHGIRHDDEKALIEAAQVYAEAGGFLSESLVPLEWAQAHVDLGHLMLVLGERESRPERFLAAALHFKPAVDVFSRHHDLDRWAQAQIGLAMALKRSGEFQGDVVTLGDAAFAFRAALGRLTKDRAPQDWADAQLGLGETLVRIAEETGDTDALEKAVPALKAALAQPREVAPSLDVTSAQAALGRAYASLGSQQQDDVMLQDAISLLESALASGSRALSTAEQAVIEQVRGTALWSLGEKRASVRLLDDAMRAKLNAVEIYEQMGEFAVAGRIREDLDDLSNVIDSISNASPRTTFGTEAARAG